MGLRQEACELLNNARREASSRGLDPRAVNCPPDIQAVCTGVGCLKIGEGVPETPPGQQSEKLYGRLERHFEVVNRNNG